MTEADQIEQQAETIETLRYRLCKAEKRIEVQQGMIDWQKARIEELEATKTPTAIAEEIFKWAEGAAGGQG